MVAFAANFPDRLSKLIIVDSAFGREEGGGGGEKQATGNPILTFKSVEDAMAHFAKINNPPRIGKDQARAMEALAKVENGWALKRDPDHGNTRPIDEAAGLPQRIKADHWGDLKKITCPIMVVRGLRSNRYPAEILARIKNERPDITWAEVDSEHDVPFQAPDALVAAVKKFVGDA